MLTDEQGREDALRASFLAAYRHLLEWGRERMAEEAAQGLQLSAQPGEVSPRVDDRAREIVTPLDI